jgi:hypothetical protein
LLDNGTLFVREFDKQEHEAVSKWNPSRHDIVVRHEHVQLEVFNFCSFVQIIGQFD